MAQFLPGWRLLRRQCWRFASPRMLRRTD